MINSLQSLYVDTVLAVDEDNNLDVGTIAVAWGRENISWSIKLMSVSYISYNMLSSL